MIFVTGYKTVTVKWILINNKIVVNLIWIELLLLYIFIHRRIVFFRLPLFLLSLFVFNIFAVWWKYSFYCFIFSFPLISFSFIQFSFISLCLYVCIFMNLSMRPITHSRKVTQHRKAKVHFVVVILLIFVSFCANLHNFLLR